MTAPTTPTGSRTIIARASLPVGVTSSLSLSMASACQRMVAAVSGMSMVRQSLDAACRRRGSRCGPAPRRWRRWRRRRRTARACARRGPWSTRGRGSTAARAAADGRVDVGGIALRDLGERLTGGRVLRREPPPVGGVDEATIDEQAGAQVEVGGDGSHVGVSGRDRGRDSMVGATRRRRQPTRPARPVATTRRVAIPEPPLSPNLQKHRRWLGPYRDRPERHRRRPGGSP